MQSLADIFDSLGGVTAVAAYLSKHLGRRVPIGTVSAWTSRNGSVPDVYRPGLITMASERGVAGVTFESLTLICAKRPDEAGRQPAEAPQ